jgi:ABC-2 type transport system permease protein
MKFPGLVENEMLKIAKQRRFRVVVLILVALIGLIVYGSFRARDRFHEKDWHVEAQERTAWLQGRIRDSRTPPTALRWFRFELARLQYHLDRNLDPDAISGPLFARAFANHASYLLLPLLAIVFASDIVSAEFAQGTIKLLLTRPVGRAWVLGSKLAALLLAITLTVLLGGLVAYLFGGLAFGYRGWEAPVLTGFRASGQGVDPAAIRSVALWKDAVLAYGLAWFAALCVGAIALLTSVLLRSTAAAMGTMVAALIAGSIVPRLAPSWEAQKFLFVTALPLPDYYSGSPPPIPGLTVGLAVAVLAAWAAAALLAAFWVFTRRDVLA